MIPLRTQKFHKRLLKLFMPNIIRRHNQMMLRSIDNYELCGSDHILNALSTSEWDDRVLVTLKAIKCK